jgi:predicted ATPase/class 3 adenylate cyclase
MTPEEAPTAAAPCANGALAVGPVLRALREARGLTRAAWADFLGYRRATVQRWEAGRRVPDAQAEAALLRLCAERGLFRRYDEGRLQGITVTPAWLQDLLAAARLGLAGPTSMPVAAAARNAVLAPAAARPQGTVTFLFTDVEGSTRRWEEHPQAMRAVMARHDALLSGVFEAHDGVVVRPRGEGDSLFTVFVRASDAVAAALAGQRALAAEDWGEVGPLRVRMGLHTGEADVRDGDYYGSAVNRCARIRGAGHGGQVLLSQTTADLVRTQLPAGVAMLDLGRHRLRGLSEPELIYELTAPDLQGSFPPLTTLDARPHNLPRTLTSFVGRDQEVSELAALLGTASLVTLTGPGGTGKTRLALAVAAEALDAFPDGVWFVDLSGVSDPAGVVPALAQVLGVVDSGGQTLAVALAAYLRHRHLLLVLDNFEQVVVAALVVHDLLVEAPQLIVLVTSRTLLRVEGEHEYPVPPMPLPDPTTAVTVPVLAQNPAVALFVARAAAVGGGFRLTAENAPAVGELCRRLEGLPLAIELAAARVKLLPPAALLARLDRRLPLLRGGARLLPARQQTLKATIQWSWDLLTIEEQVLFRRLGVFAGGWTLAAVEAVCNPDGELDIFDGLTSLVDQSLAQQHDLGGEPRFSMLAMVREFAVEQLEASAEAEALHRRHAEYVCAVAEQALTRALWSERLMADLLWPLDPERDNALAALHWVLERRDAALAPRLAGALGAWFFFRAPGEGRRWLERLLAVPSTGGPSRAHAIALTWGVGSCALAQGETRTAIACWEEAAGIFRVVEDVPWLSRTLVMLGAYWPAVDATEADAALALADEGLALARATGEAHTIAFAENCAGLAQLRQGNDLAAAKQHYEVALRLTRALDADWLTMAVLSNLAYLAQVQAQHAEARHLLQELRPLARAFGDRYLSGHANIYLALEASADGDPQQAAAEWRDGLTAVRDLGSVPYEVVCLAGIAWVLAVRGQAHQATRLLAASDTGSRGVEPYEDFRRLFPMAYEPALAAARAALNPEMFAQAWEEGQALSLEQATDLALAALADLADAEVVDPATSA